MKVKRDTTFLSFLFGDFDKDGTKNIDDFKPFDPDKEKWPTPNKNRSYYHKARFGGYETKLSDVLRMVEQKNNANSPMLINFLNENEGSYGRVKTVPSTIEKMIKKSHHNISDVAGATVIVKNRKKVFDLVKKIRKKHSVDPSETDNFYEDPKDDVYYAYHLGLIGPDQARMELQIKSKEMEKLHIQMHEAYKRGQDLKVFEKRAKKLYNQGF